MRPTLRLNIKGLGLVGGNSLHKALFVLLHFIVVLSCSLALKNSLTSSKV